MKKGLLPIIIIIAVVAILARLFYLQIIDDSYKLKSENNAIKKKYEYPERGYIYDRNGKLMVANQPSYDIMVVPREVKNLDTLAFCQLLNISKAEFIEKMDKARKFSPWLPSFFLPQLNKKEYAEFQEKMRRFPGFYTQKRSLRDYQTKSAANVFGYITQVDENTIQKNPYYKSGDLIGRQGVEQTYEDVLRGVKGVKYIQKDKLNRDIGSFKDGIYDTVAVRGKDINITIDLVLQEYGESLMVNKRGGIVAIEPKTGEILALVTAPNYDPAILTGRDRSKNISKLLRDTIRKPLFDRALLAEYPPGSPFKILTGLIGLQEQVIDLNTSFNCNRGFSYARGAFMKCHDRGSMNLIPAVQHSCNTYFASVYKKIIDKYPTPQQGTDAWSAHLRSFGLGEFLGYDLPTGRRGNIPDAKYYNRWYPRGGWRSSTIISNSIGQGEVQMTPIQLANMMAIVANKGWYYTPHIIKNIEGQEIDEKFRTKHYTTIDAKYFEPMIEGLHQVYLSGTASRLQVKGIDICGKTGTAENKMKINGKSTQLTDHSVFVAFAPKDDPKIAIAVFIENGYWGARYAGPIASLMIEKYIKGEISRKDLEDRMYNETLEFEYAKPYSGAPFPINQSVIRRIEN